MTIAEKFRAENAEKGWQNRLRGEKFEYQVMRYLKKNSHFTIRSAGSHSFADIISLRKNGETWLISCKFNGYLTKQETKQLEKKKKLLPKYYKIKLACAFGSFKDWDISDL